MAGSLVTAVGRNMVTLSLSGKSFTSDPIHVKTHCVKLHYVCLSVLGWVFLSLPFLLSLLAITSLPAFLFFHSYFPFLHF